MTVDWKKLTPDEFESLCAHLLMRQGFRNVRKIGGPGDRGRDIVADRAEHILGSKMRTAKWIAICKRYTTSAPTPTSLESDITWCGAHAPNGIFIFTPLNITPATHDWLEARQKQLGFEAVVIDKEVLEHELHVDPSLEEYFFGAAEVGAGNPSIFYREIEARRRHDYAIYTAGKMADEPVRHALAPWREAVEKAITEKGVPVDLLHPEFVGCDHTGIAASSTVELDSYMINQADAMFVYLSEPGMYATIAEAMLAHSQQIPVEFFVHESLIIKAPERVGMMTEVYTRAYKTRHGCPCLVYMEDQSKIVGGYSGVDPLVRTEYWWLLTLFRETRRNVRFHIVSDEDWVSHMRDAASFLIDA